MGVDDEDQHCRVINRDTRLPQDFLRNKRFIVRHQSAGIHNFQRPPAPLGLAVDAVARNSRLICNDGATRARQPVEKRGFAHIRTPHNYKRW